MTCLHCRTRKAGYGHRLLCQTCWRDKDIRNQYPAAKPRTDLCEPTEAELDALIAERMQTLPAWWNTEAKRELFR